MTQKELISLVRQPETVTAENLLDLKEMVESYPFFVPARILLTKALSISNSIYFESNLKTTTTYIPNRNWFYYYLHPDKLLSDEPYKRESNSNHSGGYFDMMKTVESNGEDTKTSLKNLAEKLKSARNMVSYLPTKSTVSVSESIEVEEGSHNPVQETLNSKCNSVSSNENSKDYFSINTLDITIENAKKLILEKNYNHAIVILRELNLNNPKKSVYFADQIRFLEKVVSNSKK